MSFTLENWNTLISNTLSPANTRLQSLNDESIKTFINLSKAEADTVRIMFLEGILEKRKIKDKQQFVKLNQAMLIRLLDKLYFYRKDKNIHKKIVSLYTEVSHHLEGMLDYIEDFFGNYFDRNDKVPALYLEASIKELSKQIQLIEEGIRSYPPYIHAIVNILTNNFKNFCIKKKNSATYRELMYQKELMNQLLTDNTLASEDTIKEVLSYFNYNDSDYIAYIYEKLSLITERINNKKEKISVLRFEQKKFNQLPVRLNCSLSDSMPSLKEQVNVWIEEEIKFLEAEQVHAGENLAETNADKAQMTVHVPFKGSEIYLLHKSFIDSGGATGETYKSLFEKTGAHLSNKNQKGFSTESLQKCSDKVDYEAKENVKRFLQKMIRNIDSY